MALVLKNHSEITRSSISLYRDTFLLVVKSSLDIFFGHFKLPGMLEELDPDLMLELDKEVQS